MVFIYLTTYSVFFTVLNMGMVCFRRKPNSSISLVNIHFLTTLIMIFGLYITHVIKKMEANVIDLTPIGLNLVYRTTFTDKPLVAVNFIIHTLPFILTWSILGKPTNSLEANILTMFFISIYFMIVDTKKVYLFDTIHHKKNYGKLIVISFVVYLFLYFIV